MSGTKPPHVTFAAEERQVAFRLARLQRRLDRLPPELRTREVWRIRLQILRNSIRVAAGTTTPARAVLLEQVDELAACVGVPLFQKEALR